MKKIIGLILSLSIVCSSLIFPVNASSELSITDSSPTIITFEDGSYLTISPIQSCESITRTTTTKNAYQLYTFTNSSGELEWEFVLNATFNYVYGTSVTCTAASYDYTIYANSWKFSDGSASHSGATAYGSGTFKNKVLFITTKTVYAELEITCDVYGNLS